MAGLDFFHGLIMLDHQPPPPDGLAPDCAFEEGAKGIVAQNSDDNGIVCAGKSAGRPFRELGEVEKEYCLNLIFPRRGLGVEAREWNEEAEKKHPPEKGSPAARGRGLG